MFVINEQLILLITVFAQAKESKKANRKRRRNEIPRSWKRIDSLSHRAALLPKVFIHHHRPVRCGGDDGALRFLEFLSFSRPT